MPSSALASKPRKRFTAEEYLSLERAAAAEKSEFYDGEIFAMSGAKAGHNIVALNIAAKLLALRRSGCQPFGSDMKVAITPSGPFFYPDVSLACGKQAFLDSHEDVLLNPTLIVEVLSKSTQRYDREIKLPAYQSVATVQTILLVSAERPSVDAYFRNARGGWKHQTAAGLAAVCQVPSPALSLPLRDIYEGASLPRAARA